MNRLIRSLRHFLGRLAALQDGLAAIEFALIAPVMLVTYFGTVELADALIVNRKATSVASTAADLVAQDTAITNAEMSDVFAALDAILFPYSSADASIVISSVISDGQGGAKVAWSDAQNYSARAVDSLVTIPEGLITTGSSVIFAEVRYSYRSPAGQLIYGTIEMSDKFYVRPRRTLQVARVP